MRVGERKISQAAVFSALLVTALFISEAAALAAPGPGAAMCEKEIVAASRKHGIPVGILYSVGLTETGRRGSLQPYALNIEGKTVFAGTLSEALETFYRARKAGRKLIDLGCMQINHHYHRGEFTGPRAMLDPRQNVDYAAKFLVDLKRRHKSWTMAVARYHAGPNNDPAQRKYVCRVIKNLVATGYGRWTRPARAFCNNNH